ncbi:membrane integrity-associated transporter subunit PqiC [Methylomonas sp. HYX-M1]|uniref:PqiC family protein n=1 Tax=Methylomonas sp. HYX-M1 TaxID=3139307 RepID=UPI00345B93CA
MKPIPLPRCFPILLLALWGCASTPAANFFLLEPLPMPHQREAAGFLLVTLELGPIKIPAYLDRAQLVYATADNRYRLDEFNRWAEPLDDNIGRVLTIDLQNALGAKVLPPHSPLADQTTYKIALNVLQFHRDGLNQAILNADWLISQQGKQLVQTPFNCAQLVRGDTAADQVAALNTCLNQLSGKLADNVKSLLRR